MEEIKNKYDKKLNIYTYIKSPVKADIIRLSWPIVLELIMGTLFGMVDMIMLGRLANLGEAAESVAAVGITNQPMFVGLSLVQALNVGGTAMIARYLGAGKPDKIESTLKHTIILNLIGLGIPLGILGIVFSDQIMQFMGAGQDVIIIGNAYFRIIMVGFIFQSFNMSITAALRGVGQTKVPMKINILVNFMNVFGNAILIYGLFGAPRLGITGAGISTSLSNAAASVLLLAYVLKGDSIVRLNLRNKFRFNRDIMANLVKIGVPASLESLALRVAILIFVKIVAGLGTVVYAAHQIALSILGLSFQPGQGFGIAASSLVGRSLGAGDTKKAEEYAKETRKMGSVVATVIALLFFFFGSDIVSLYSTDPEIIRNASGALKIIALVQPFQVSQLVLAGALRGAGDTFWPLLATFVGSLPFRLIIAYVLVNNFGMGLTGAWAAVLVDQLVRWFFVMMRFRTGKWKYIKIR